jgi:serine/threonine protein phosphatase 1
MPAVIYAIGDIHGCYRQLKALEKLIIEDSAGIAGEKWIVCLGDYVDRGPASAMVLDHLIAKPPSGFRRICLAGNHEQIAFDFLRNGDYGNGWLDFGGRESLASYGLYDPDPKPARLGRQLASHVPEEHIEFLGSLPTMLALPGLVFVHAGIDPGQALEAQRDDVLLWSRPRDLPWPASGTGYRVVHGHTPVAEPDLGQERVNVDLGAYSSGILCGLKVTSSLEMSPILAG